MKENGTPDILGRHNACAIVAEITLLRRFIDDMLIHQRRIVARINGSATSTRAMALRAIRVDIRPRTVFQRRAQVGNGDQLGERRNVRFVQSGVKQAKAVKRPQLVVALEPTPAVVKEVSIELTGFDAEHITRLWGVTGQTIG